MIKKRIIEISIPHIKPDMTTPRLIYKWFKLFSGLITFISPVLQAQEIIQTVVLKPGWNAVHIEVQPRENHITNIFANVPVSSIWRWRERSTSVQFIREQSEVDYNTPDWQVYFPPEKPESFKNSLFRIFRHNAYLINLAGSVPVTLQITGEPAQQVISWVPDSFNLKGLPVDPSNPPTCAEYFRTSPAHYDNSKQQVRAIYRLESDGHWSLMSNTDRLESGVAYWIYCKGGSGFTAPLELELPVARMLDFTNILTKANVYLHNRSVVPVVVSITGGDSLPIAYGSFDVEKGTVWTPMPAVFQTNIDNGQKLRIQVVAQRKRLVGNKQSGIIEIKNGRGVRYSIPVNIARMEPGQVSPFAGLWVGSVSITKVSEVNGLKTNVTGEIINVTEGSDPTPVSKPFYLRLFVHVDAQGKARLLKDVYQLWKDGTVITNAAGLKVTETPGKFVLVSTPDLIGKYKPGAMRDGEYVGRRISTIDFDFYNTNQVFCNGQFELGGTISANIILPAMAPTNPFRHKYHPDHDNLDATFKNFVRESYDITRYLEVNIYDVQDSPLAADGGYETLQASYKEVVTGLHRLPITATGDIKFQRVVPDPNIE